MVLSVSFYVFSAQLSDFHFKGCLHSGYTRLKGFLFSLLIFIIFYVLHVFKRL
jgi:hypothetical protein